MGARLGRLDQTEFSPFAERPDLAAAGEVSTGPVVWGDDRPLLLSIRRLAPGASLEWKTPVQDHLIYVRSGGAEADGIELGEREVFVIEHGARALLRAGARGAELLHFERAASAKPPKKAGGRAHKAPLRLGKQEPAMGRHSAYLVCDCPTCELWLHRSEFPGGYAGTRHFHSADEIIVALEGGMRMGPVTHQRTAIALDGNAPYQFSAAPEGLTFINFRSENSLYKQANAPETQDWLDEAPYILARLEGAPDLPSGSHDKFGPGRGAVVD